MQSNHKEFKMLVSYLARRGLYLTTLGEFLLPTLGLLVMAAGAWAFIWVVS